MRKTLLSVLDRNRGGHGVEQGFGQLQRLAQALLGFDIHGDIARDAAITGERARGIEHRRAADAKVHQAASRHVDGVGEVAKRRVRLQRGAVPHPVRVILHMGHVRPARPADPLRGVAPNQRQRAGGKQRKAKLGVLFPIRIGCNLHQAFETPIGFAHPRLVLRLTALQLKPRAIEFTGGRAEVLQPQILRALELAVARVHRAQQIFQFRRQTCRGRC